MNCPRCHRSRLQAIHTRAGRIDWCTRCNGQWVTRSSGAAWSAVVWELTERAAKFRHLGRCPTGVHLLEAGGERCDGCPETPMRCPRCERRTLLVEERGQLLNLCVDCEALWFDASELGSLKILPA